jgi:hypothetical protein
MLQRPFTHDGQAYRIELSTYRAVKGDSAILRAALDALAADSYRRLRLTHSGAIDRMIERLAGRELPWNVLLAAKQKLNLI